MNLEGSFYMRKSRFKDKSTITTQLANFVGCDSKNLVVTRNTTESLDLIISGFPWKSGDEAIYASQDYGAMQDMFEQIGKRHGVVLKKVSVPNHPKNDTELISLYESQITSKTRLIMISHMVNITGQILPVKKICDMAHSYGVEVLVDGAHCVGHFNFKIDNLNCDYYGSSLHKWLAHHWVLDYYMLTINIFQKYGRLLQITKKIQTKFKDLVILALTLFQQI